MGWGRLFLLGDIGQQLDLQEANEALLEMRTDVARLQVGDESTAKRMARLELENDQLKLYLAAITRALVNRGTLSAAEMQRIVNEVDASDGTHDGRFSGSVIPE
jgi:hypothetical protein